MQFCNISAICLLILLAGISATFQATQITPIFSEKLNLHSVQAAPPAEISRSSMKITRNVRCSAFPVARNWKDSIIKKLVKN